jgi:hypothetical protein
MSSPLVHRHAAIAALLLCVTHPLHAQQGAEPTVCLGFAFGTWTPALDWRAAGHTSPLDPAAHQRAGDGRDWATTQAVQDEHTIVLLPAWWPAGVSVTLPTRDPALGDTVTGSAFAYVADGRLRVPRATVRAWRVPCARHAP